MIHQDQVGFLRQRNSSDNIRRLLNIMWSVRNMDSPVAAISLDAQKAYDRVEHKYLFLTLKSFGFGEPFLKWIQILYNQPEAAVQTNGLISSYFKLSRGTPQGSSLSPALFCLALEPLAAAIRMNPNFPGVVIGESVHKLMLYADDILLLVSDPEQSIHTLLETINSFSKLSGYKVNWSKSEALPLTAYCPRTLFQEGAFQWPAEGLKYLGITFPQQIDDVIRVNMEPLFRKISTYCGEVVPPINVNVGKSKCTKNELHSEA